MAYTHDGRLYHELVLPLSEVAEESLANCSEQEKKTNDEKKEGTGTRNKKQSKNKKNKGKSKRRYRDRGEKKHILFPIAYT